MVATPSGPFSTRRCPRQTAILVVDLSPDKLIRVAPRKSRTGPGNLIKLRRSASCSRLDEVGSSTFGHCSRRLAVSTIVRACRASMISASLLDDRSFAFSLHKTQAVLQEVRSVDQKHFADEHGRCGGRTADRSASRLLRLAYKERSRPGTSTLLHQPPPLRTTSSRVPPPSLSYFDRIALCTHTASPYRS